jgi:hypothetical protein
LLPSYNCHYPHNTRDDNSLIIVLETNSRLAVKSFYLTIA